jgi:hypothetical protein
MSKPATAGQLDKSLLNTLEHNLNAAANMKGVALHIDDPLVPTETFFGTDGVTDVFVFDAGVEATNAAVLRNFDPDEDYLLFQNMEGQHDLIVGDLGVWSTGAPQGVHFVLFHSNGESANIVVLDVPYQQQDIEHMVLPFDGLIKFDDPFLL